MYQAMPAKLRDAPPMMHAFAGMQQAKNVPLTKDSAHEFRSTSIQLYGAAWAIMHGFKCQQLAFPGKVELPQAHS
jgi:hypothetical protein